MPSASELEGFYKGFLFAANIRNLETILESSPRMFSSLKLQKNAQLTMLDIGGGGGFYAKAFEHFGYGRSVYVDLDSEACAFAREKVGLSNVLNLDASKLIADVQKYDFIMCRHLLEHLTDPSAFILKLIRILAKGGTLLIVCPNGDSLEYFAYPNSNLKDRVQRIKDSSQLSKLAVIRKLLTGKMLHGMDPPRHLWAISRQGMQKFLDDNHIHATVKTFSLTDPVYSPYYVAKTTRQKIYSFIGDTVMSKIAGGTHLSIVIRKPESDINGCVT